MTQKIIDYIHDIIKNVDQIKEKQDLLKSLVLTAAEYQIEFNDRLTLLEEKMKDK